MAQVRAAHGEPTTEPDMDRFSGGRTLDLDESGVSEVADVGWREG
jgi:hypothetical protein